MPWRELTTEELSTLKRPIIVDVRSPVEHAAECVPDSINIPLLSDQERAIVGTIYKQDGEMVARRHALTLIAPKIPSIIDEILLLQKQHGEQIVIYCWRGGLRSESVASLLSIAGISCFRLVGGYKAWRRQVLTDFETNRYGLEPVVLQGLTGVGKTEILLELDRRGLQVIDLEGLANHRGSLFGGLGLGDQPTQKNFDAAIWQKLRKMSPDLVFMEAESRRIGRLQMPDLIYKNMIRRGPYILVTCSLNGRVDRITNDYLRSKPSASLSEALILLPNLKERLGASRLADIQELALAEDIKSVIQLLLSEYYDPLYSREICNVDRFELTISGEEPAIAANQLERWVGERKVSTLR